MKNADAQDRFDIAVKRDPAWTLAATTYVDWVAASEASYPKVASVECTGESAQFSFRMNSSGALESLHTRLLGEADEDGDREEITRLGDRIWLYIDGERWEYAQIPSHSDEFSNISYPPPETSIIIGLWHGFRAVRKSDDQPWINFDLLNHRLMTAKQIEWQFKSRNWADLENEDVDRELGPSWQTTRYRIDNEGLNDAIMWCARQVSSESAYILPDEVLENHTSTE